MSDVLAGCNPVSYSLEEWRPVVGYESLYAVSNLGRVRRVTATNRGKAGRILKPKLGKRGYYVVNLCNRPTRRNRNITVHRLVAEVFIGPLPNGRQINHKDGIKTNNHIANLEYVTAADNRAHAVRLGLCAKGSNVWCAKLTEDTVRSIREMRSRMTYQQLADHYGIVYSHAYRIVNRTCWAGVD